MELVVWAGCQVSCAFLLPANSPIVYHAAVQEATHDLAEAQDAVSAVEVERQLLEDRLHAITQAGAGRQ